MPKILLLSDTHSHCESALIPFINDCDEIWHAGDWGNEMVYNWLASFQKPIRGVFGNIDGLEIKKRFPEDLFFDLEGFQVWMTHIAGYPGRYHSRVRDILNKKSPNLLICGHSHIIKAQKDDKFDMWVLNPGAAGKEGFHQIKTAMTFELKDKNLLNFKIVELGSRSGISKK